MSRELGQRRQQTKRKVKRLVHPGCQVPSACARAADVNALSTYFAPTGISVSVNYSSFVSLRTRPDCRLPQTESQLCLGNNSSNYKATSRKSCTTSKFATLLTKGCGFSANLQNSSCRPTRSSLTGPQTELRPAPVKPRRSRLLAGPNARLGDANVEIFWGQVRFV
jgi:hypothetical protein